MKRVALRNSKRFLLAFSLIAGLVISVPVPEAKAANDMQASCVIGSSSTCPAQSPQEIYNLYGTTTNGTYWLNVNGTATETYLILDTNYPDSGGWFLGMKGVKSSTSFTYSSDKWTSQNTLNPSSLSNDVSTDAKFNAFNYLPVTKLLAVFKDRDSNAFNAAGSGDYGANSFLGHTWQENVASTTMFARFTTNSNITDATGNSVRYTVHRETNSSSGKLVFPYQTGWTRYGFNNSTGYNYRWGTTSNNESSMGSNDSGSGIGMDSYSAAGIISYSDNLTVGPNGFSGATNPGTITMPSGFQIWGKMAAPSLATPGALSLTNQGSGSVQLSFAASSGATEYAIQYKAAGSNWSSGTTVRMLNPSASPSATLTGLTNGSYDFRVFARATNNSSAGNSYLLAQTIDATAPTVSSIAVTSSSGADNIYALGDTITVAIGWSETITVTGSPRLQIQGLTSKYLTYASGSGTRSTVFNYVVTNGDLDRDGFSISANSLALNSGTIKDLASNDANLTHSAISSTNSLQIDGVLPTLSSASIASNGSRITLSFSETISSTISAYSAITVTVESVRDVVSGGGTADSRLSMDLNFAATSGAVVTLSYTDPTTGNDVNALQDEAGNDLASFSNFSVTNNSSQTSNTTVALALNPSSPTATYRASTSLKANVTAAGKVSFFQNGKIIASCRNIATTASSPFYATCNWKPSIQQYVLLRASYKSTTDGFTDSVSPNLRIYVTKRSGLR